MITDEDGNFKAKYFDPLQPHILELLEQSESEWRATFVTESTDFLLEQHSPATIKALAELMQSQVLQAVIEEDGPTRRTRSSSQRLLLGSDDDIPLPGGMHDNAAGGSGTATDSMDLEEA